MTPLRARRLPCFFALVAGLSVALPGASAQTEKKQPASPLQGPKVADREVPGSAPDFGMGVNRRFGERVPPEVFRRAVGVLTADDAPADIRATPEQREKFKELVDGFEASVRKFRQQHAKEFQELRQAAGEVGRGDRPGVRRPKGAEDEQMKPAEEMTPEQQTARDEARAKLRELMGEAPKIEDIYTKVWTELTEAQQKAVQGELDKWRAEQEKKREDEYVQRQKGKKKTAPPEARPAAPVPPKLDDAMMPASKSPGKPDARNDAEAPRLAARRERLMRIFSQLTPEEQEQLLQRLEERMRGRRRPNAPDEGSSKPPANPDRVKVPNPQDDKQ